MLFRSSVGYRVEAQDYCWHRKHTRLCATSSRDLRSVKANAHVPSRMIVYKMGRFRSGHRRFSQNFITVITNNAVSNAMGDNLPMRSQHNCASPLYIPLTTSAARCGARWTIGIRYCNQTPSSCIAPHRPLRRCVSQSHREDPIRRVCSVRTTHTLSLTEVSILYAGPIHATHRE